MSKVIMRLTAVFEVGPDVSIGVSMGRRGPAGILRGAGNHTVTLRPSTLITLPDGSTMTGAKLREALEAFAEQETPA